MLSISKHVSLYSSFDRPLGIEQVSVQKPVEHLKSIGMVLSNAVNGVPKFK